jgi:DNA recombination protein RmuC
LLNKLLGYRLSAVRLAPQLVTIGHMEVTPIIVGVLAGGAIIIIAGYLLLRGKLDVLLAKLLEKNEELRAKNKTEMDSSVKAMLSDNKEKIDLIVRELRNQLKDSQTDAKSLREQNAALQQHLTEAVTATKELRISTDGLKNLLSNNRLRGEWGEQVAEDLLLGAGLVENINYTKQTVTDTGRPDFTILLPDDTKLNVDAKFPFDDLVAYQEASSDTERKRALKNFEQAVKDKVKQITSKDYIDPANGTVDFVVMFIPNEMIFSFIYEKVPGINLYCNQRKVIMTGPFGFTALVRLVLQAYKNFHYEQGLQHILGLIEQFQLEYGKFGGHMERLGKQIETAHRTFTEVEGTRNKQLTRVVEKITDYSAQEKLSSKSEEAVTIEKRLE